MDMKILLAVGVGLVLAGCTLGQQAFVDESIQRKRAYSDTEANVLKNAPCAMTVGGFNRVLSQDERDAVMTLCGGAGGNISLDDLVKAERAMRALRAVE
jgi:hypothetical protein